MADIWPPKLLPARPCLLPAGLRWRQQRTARLASIIPLIRGDYVPQSFVDVDAESYPKATIALYEFNEVGPLADLYAWESRGKSSKHGRSSASNHHCA